MPLSSGPPSPLRFLSLLTHCPRSARAGFVFAVGLMVGATGVLAQDANAELIAKGRYIATAGDCAACHTAPHGGQPFAGGYGIVSPLGTIFSTNITPSKTKGIGNYSEEEFARAVREGVAKDGTHLYPAMPYTAYAKTSDDDIKALYAYFMSEVKPVDTNPQKTELPFPFSIRASMAGWNLFFLDSARFKPDASKSEQWNRGAYLAEGLEHCSSCHTPRNLLMAESSNKALSGGPLGSWYAPNITSDPVSGIGGWSEDELVAYMRTGRVAGKAQAAGPMAEAVENSLQHLTDDDLKAIAVYVKSTEPVSSAATTPRYGYGKPSGAEFALRGLPGQAAGEDGFHVFSGSCAACHQVNGQGNAFYPSLFNNTATGAPEPDNLVSTILFGLTRTVGDTHTFMPAFGPASSFTDRLSDKEVADVSNYVLTQFGNPDVTLTEADVARIREGGEKPLLAKLAPYAARAVALIVLLILAAFAAAAFRRQPRQAST